MDFENTITNLPAHNMFLEDNLLNIGVPTPCHDELRGHEPAGVTIETSEDGVPLMRINAEDIYDRNDPLGRVKLEVDNIEGDDSANLIVLFGLGLGYHAERLERRFPCHIIVFDPSLDSLKTCLGARSLPLRRTIIVPNTGHLMSEVQPRLQFTDRKVIAAAVPAYQKLFPEEFALFKSVVEEAISNATILENTVAARSVEWTHHITENIPKALQRISVSDLGNRFAGKPGILVAAGPSLDGNIEHLRRAKGHAFILAVNASVRPLKEAGVKPDMVAVVEGLDLRSQLTESGWIEEMTLAPALNSHPGFFDLPVKYLMPILDYSTPCSEWFSRALGWTRLPSGGSVACTGFAILHALGCDPIVLVGQDLAYTGGASYSRSTTFGRRQMDFDEKTKTLLAVERNQDIEEIRTSNGLDPMIRLRAEEVDAYGGQGTVCTTGMYKLFRSWFESAARTWADDRKLINATEGGARIRDFEEIPLGDVVERWCTEAVPAEEWIAEAHEVTQPPNPEPLYTIIKEYLETVSHVSKIALRSSAIAAKASKEIELGGAGAAEPSLRELAALENELRAHSRENTLLDMYVAMKVNQLRINRADDHDEDTARQTMNSLRRSEKLFCAVSEGASELIEIFSPLLERQGSAPGD